MSVTSTQLSFVLNSFFFFFAGLFLPHPQTALTPPLHASAFVWCFWNPYSYLFPSLILPKHLRVPGCLGSSYLCAGEHQPGFWGFPHPRVPTLEPHRTLKMFRCARSKGPPNLLTRRGMLQTACQENQASETCTSPDVSCVRARVLAESAALASGAQIVTSLLT